MSTEDDLRHLGQAAAALAGLAAGRAKQVAEQLLGSREKEREEPKRRGLVEEGRYAAADVVSALRREASVILHDLEQLEQALRAGEDDGATTTTTSATTLQLIEGVPAKPTAADEEGTTAPRARKASGARQTTGAKAAGSKASSTKETGTKATGKKATGKKAAGPRKATGRSGPSSEGQG